MADGLVINTNMPAANAAASLNKNNIALQNSIMKLSTGYRINNTNDDAGGMAVSMKMAAALQRNQAAKNNVGNAISFLQTQDGAMNTVALIMQRISELKLLDEDSTKSESDTANYDTEFSQLSAQLTNLLGEKFNGVSIFSDTADTTFTVITSEDGTQTIDVTLSHLAEAITTIQAASALSDISVDDTTTAIENIATLRARNGAETNRLEFASAMLTTSQINLEAANSRIKDTDIAAESTSFAKFSILVQSGTAMLAQANTVPQAALRLIG